MPALGVKVAAVAGAALVLLVPAFNSLNQVTVEDAEPPFTLDDPPPNLPPPQEGDDFEIPPPPGAEGEPCPPPEAEERASWSWEFPQPQTTTQSFVVSPGSGGLAYVGNLSNFVGKVTVTLVDPEDSPTVIFEFDSSDANAENGQRVGNRAIGPQQFPGAAPGEWQVTILVGDDVGALGIRQPATGHVDFQLYEVFPCGGAGRA